MKNIEKLYILWYTKTVNTMGNEGIYLADIINQADKLSEKQSEYMKLIAEIMEIVMYLLSPAKKACQNYTASKMDPYSNYIHQDDRNPQL